MPAFVLPAVRVSDEVPARVLVTEVTVGTNGCLSTWGADYAGCPPPRR
jgi:hypothetical protein